MVKWTIWYIVQKDEYDLIDYIFTVKRDKYAEMDYIVYCIEGRVWSNGLDWPTRKNPGPPTNPEQACDELSGHRGV